MELYGVSMASMVPSNFGLGVDFLKVPLWDS